MFEGFNNYDYFVIGVIAFSTFFGFARGFSGEVCSIVKLILSSAISAYSVIYLKNSFFAGDTGIVSNIVLSVVPGATFVVSSILLGILLFPVKEFLRAVIPFLIDRVFGVALAFIKGALLVLIVHLALTFGFETVMGKNIDWVDDAELKPYLDSSSEDLLDTGIIQAFISDKVSGDSKKSKKDKDLSFIDFLKSKFDFLSDAETKKDESVDNVDDVKEDEGEGDNNAMQNLLEGFLDKGEDEAKDKGSDINLDKVKVLIDTIKN